MCSRIGTGRVPPTVKRHMLNRPTDLDQNLDHDNFAPSPLVLMMWLMLWLHLNLHQQQAHPLKTAIAIIVPAPKPMTVRLVMKGAFSSSWCSSHYQQAARSLLIWSPAVVGCGMRQRRWVLAGSLGHRLVPGVLVLKEASSGATQSWSEHFTSNSGCPIGRKIARSVQYVQSTMP